MSQKKIKRTKDTGISYRVINHWSKIGLIPSNVGKKWHEFTDDEVVRIKVIKSLRKIGLSIKAIRKLI